MQEYWKGEDVLLEMANMANVQLVHNVDATALSKVPELQNRRFDYIVFQFPHIPGKAKMHMYVACAPASRLFMSQRKPRRGGDRVTGG